MRELVNKVVKDDDMEDNFDDPNMLVGEDLLKKHFSLSGLEAVRVKDLLYENWF